MSGDPDYDAQLRKEMGEVSKKISVIQERLELSSRSNPELKKLMDEVTKKRSLYIASREAIFQTKTSGGQFKEMLETKFTPDLREYELSIQRVDEYYQKQILNQSQDMKAKLYFGITILMVLGGFIFIIGIVASWWIGRSITKPIYEALRVTEAVAHGDLSVDIKTDTNDEAGQLLRALEKMRNNLETIVKGIRTGAQSIVSSSQQLAIESQQLSVRTEQQASSLEQTSATMHEMQSTVQDTAKNAAHAHDQAREATEVTKKGEGSVSGVIRTMHDMNESSQKIVEIIGTINGIAFQTNILALNAAVEAARAGDHGKGFAVVALEVRNLAQRSTIAAQEIKTLLNASVERTETGLMQVEIAGKEMGLLLSRIHEMLEMLQPISNTTKQQNISIREIHDAISQIENFTQQNATLAEEATRTTQGLTEQAEGLARRVSVFVIR